MLSYHAPDDCWEQLSSKDVDCKESGHDTKLADHGQSCDNWLVFWKATKPWVQIKHYKTHNAISVMRGNWGRVGFIVYVLRPITTVHENWYRKFRRRRRMGIVQVLCIELLGFYTSCTYVSCFSHLSTHQLCQVQLTPTCRPLHQSAWRYNTEYGDQTWKQIKAVLIALERVFLTKKCCFGGKL